MARLLQRDGPSVRRDGMKVFGVGCASAWQAVLLTIFGCDRMSDQRQSQPPRRHEASTSVKHRCRCAFAKEREGVRK